MVSYLIAPPAAPPRYGLDHEFAVDSREFVATVDPKSGKVTDLTFGPPPRRSGRPGVLSLTGN